MCKDDKSKLVPTLDDWYPNYLNEYGIECVKVSFLHLNPKYRQGEDNMWRVTVSGNDDDYVNKDFVIKKDAEDFYELLIGQAFITHEMCYNLDMAMN